MVKYINLDRNIVSRLGENWSAFGILVDLKRGSIYLQFIFWGREIRFYTGINYGSI